MLLALISANFHSLSQIYSSAILFLLGFREQSKYLWLFLVLVGLLGIFLGFLSNYDLLASFLDQGRLLNQRDAAVYGFLLRL